MIIFDQQISYERRNKKKMRIFSSIDRRLMMDIHSYKEDLKNKKENIFKSINRNENKGDCWEQQKRGYFK